MKNFLVNLPFILFSIVVFIIAIFLLFSGITWLKARQEPQKEKSRKLLFHSLLVLLGVLIVSLIFNLVMYFLQQEAGIPPSLGEFPGSPEIGFPSAP